VSFISSKEAVFTSPVPPNPRTRRFIEPSKAPAVSRTVMKTTRISLEGVVLLLVGAVLSSTGIFMLAKPNEYRAVARIKVHREVQAARPGDPVAYDPYFIQTEFEVIQSEIVLSKVVEKLDLASEWGKKRAAGDRLKPVEAIGLLKRQMDLRPVRNTELIEIAVSSDDPAEAAKLANTIAEAFRDYRLEQNRLLKTEAEKANPRPLESYAVEIVDSAIAPAKPIRPNRPLAAAVLLFGLLLIILGVYSATQSGST
jgi:capsular polysaccharide biosynthesis protein